MIDISVKGAVLREELMEPRCYFYAHLEQFQQGFNTQKKICDYLDALGILYMKVCKIGMTVIVAGKHFARRVLGTRVDIDALPATEFLEVVWKFENEGCMHVCGYDAHIIMPLDTVKLLERMEDEPTATVKLLFQSAEEFIADSGAGLMGGESEALTCDRLIIMHIRSKIPVGYISLHYSSIMSVTDTLDSYVKSKSGYGALPRQAVDPIVAGAELTIFLQCPVSRELNLLELAAASVTSSISGTIPNMTPGETHLMGTARAFNPEIQNRYPEMLRRVANGVAMATRTGIQLGYHLGPPPTINDDACVDTEWRAAERVFGKEHLLDWEQQMSGESSAKYKAPKYLLLLGGGFSEEERHYPQYNPHLDIDKSALQLGIRHFCEYVREYGKEV